MKVLSHQEYEFLKNPGNFNRNYQYVLTHRIKKKVRSMENNQAFINHYSRSLLTEKKKIDYDWMKAKEKWMFIVHQAFDQLKKDKDEKYKTIADKFQKKYTKAKNVDDFAEADQWYNREIVKLYLGEKYLQYEVH